MESRPKARQREFVGSCGVWPHFWGSLHDVDASIRVPPVRVQYLHVLHSPRCLVHYGAHLVHR